MVVVTVVVLVVVCVVVVDVAELVVVCVVVVFVVVLELVTVDAELVVVVATQVAENVMVPVLQEKTPFTEYPKAHPGVHCCTLPKTMVWPLCTNADVQEPLEFAGRGAVHRLARHVPDDLKKPASHEYWPDGL